MSDDDIKAAALRLAARGILAADLDTARTAVKGANACLPEETGYRYAVALVHLDGPLPLGIVEVDASALYPGTTLPEEPSREDTPYAPPEERGHRDPAALSVTQGGIGRSTREFFPASAVLDEPLVREALAGMEIAAEELGEHVFPADPRIAARCIHCGLTLEEAQVKRRCGA